MAHMDDAAGAPDHIRLDAEGRIDDDLPCIDCGYNLRTCPPDGSCPECGGAVLQSMRYLLRFADPAWLRRLGWGTVWVIAGMCWGFLWEAWMFLGWFFVWPFWSGRLLSVALMAWGVVILIRRIRIKILRDVALVGTVLVVVIGFPWLAALVTCLSPWHVGGILALVGWWLLTTPEPGRREITGKINARKAARIVMTAALVGSMVYWPVFARHGSSPTVQAFETPIAVVHVLAVIVAFRYLARLAERMPRPRLAKQAAAIGWCLAVSAALAYLGGMIYRVGFAPGSAGATPSASPAALETVLTWGTGLVGIVGDAASVWAIVLCVMCARSFRRIAQSRSDCP